jgi:hypothetical protein
MHVTHISMAQVADRLADLQVVLPARRIAFVSEETSAHRPAHLLPVLAASALYGLSRAGAGLLCSETAISVPFYVTSDWNSSSVCARSTLDGDTLAQEFVNPGVTAWLLV